MLGWLPLGRRSIRLLSTMFPNVLTPATLYQNMLRSPLAQHGHPAALTGSSASFLMENLLRERACAAVMPRPLSQQQLQHQLQQQHTLHLQQQQQHQQQHHVQQLQHTSAAAAVASVGLGLGLAAPSQRGVTSRDHASPLSGQSSPVSERSIDQSKPSLPTCSSTAVSNYSPAATSPPIPQPSSTSSPSSPPPHSAASSSYRGSPSPSTSPFTRRDTPNTPLAPPTSATSQACEAAMLSLYASAQQHLQHDKQQQQSTTPFLKFGVNAILGNTESGRRSPLSAAGENR